jgi:hypothetical protein
MGRQDLFQVHPLEFATRQFQGDAATHHFGYESSQLFAHSIFLLQATVSGDRR